jgi:predicted aspartyl protease
MFLLTYSKEILYIVLAFCALWISAFIIWLAYYLIATIRDIRRVTKEAKNIVAKVDAVITLLKQKVELHSNYFSMILEGIKKVKTAVQGGDGKSTRTTKQNTKKTAKK